MNETPQALIDQLIDATTVAEVSLVEAKLKVIDKIQGTASDQ